jgi:hypothetical protein
MSTALTDIQTFRAALSIAGLRLRVAGSGTDGAYIDITTGTGAPTHSAPLDSLYIRLDASDSGSWLYRNTDGGTTWETQSDTEFAEFLAATNTFTAVQTFTAGLDSTGRVTTTDGVASGTARVIGGRAASSTAASTTIAGGSGAQAYDVTYAIPANTLKAGSHARIAAVVKAIAQNGTDTFLAQLRVGGTVVATAGAVDIAANDRAYLSCDLDCYAAPGGSVTVVYGGLAGWSTSGAGPNITGGALTLATNGAVTVDVVITYGSSNSGNTSALEALVVNIT